MFAHNSDLVRRLRREVEVSTTVKHPGIVPVRHEGVLDDGSPYVVFERLTGESVQRILRRRRPLPVDETAAVTMRVASILHASHREGYVHRDVKPEHVILNRTVNGELSMHLIDFGVCSSINASKDERDREKGRVYGTPSYVSPEQAAGKSDVDCRADVFSLGVFVFECIAGRQPFRGSRVSGLLRRIIREDAPRLGLLVPTLSLELDQVVATALSRDRDQRYPNARAFAQALAPFAADRVSPECRLAATLEVGAALPETIPTEPNATLDTAAAA